jgi:hypothetical protein
MINIDDFNMLNELEAFAKEINEDKKTESEKCTTCKTCTCDNKNKESKKMNFDVNVFRTFNHKPMVIYGRIYSDATVLKVTNDNIVVLVNDLDDDWLDSTIIAASTKTFTLPVVEYGNFPGSKVTVENYYNFWMPLEEFMCVGVKAANNTKVNIDSNKYKYNNHNEVKPNLSNVNNIEKPKTKVNIKTKEKKNFEEAANKFYLDSFKNAVNRLNIPVTIKNYIANASSVSYFGNKFGEIDANSYYIDSDTSSKVKAYFTGYDAKGRYIRFTKAGSDEKIFIYPDEIARGKYTIYRDYSPKKTKTFDEYMKKKNNPKPKKVTKLDDFTKELARYIASNDPTSTIVFGVDDDTSFDDILNKLFGNNE